MSVVFQVLSLLVGLFLVVLIIRVVFDIVQSFAREWRPHGVVLVLADLVYSATDPPLRALRRVIPPLTLGTIRLDLAFIVLWVTCLVLQQIFTVLGRS